MKKDQKKSPKEALREAIAANNDEIVKKKRHLSQEEKNALNVLNGHQDLAFMFGLVVTRLRTQGVSKADILYGTSAVLQIDPASFV